LRRRVGSPRGCPVWILLGQDVEKEELDPNVRCWVCGFELARHRRWPIAHMPGRAMAIRDAPPDEQEEEFDCRRLEVVKREART
jgi:hypothetical protein